jgi:predicted RNA-binding protein
MIVRTDHNQRFDKDGNLLSEDVVEVDITEEVVEYAIHDRLRQTIAGLQQIQDVDATNLAQVNVALDRLAKATIGLIRVVVREGLLDTDAGTI